MALHQEFLKLHSISLSTTCSYLGITSAEFGFMQKHSSLQQLLIFEQHYEPLQIYWYSISRFKKAVDNVAHNECLVNYGAMALLNLWNWFRGCHFHRCHWRLLLVNGRDYISASLGTRQRNGLERSVDSS